ncbi:MAG: MFS transporter [Deltaproteobacteria bacterium]|nr:MFS transporter [Deltaproteobacteria bacterium]
MSDLGAHAPGLAAERLAVPPVASALPRAAQASYAVGSMSYTIVERLLTMWLAFYYLDEASPGHVALSASAFFGILWVGRALDAVCDVVIAGSSDRSNARLGRRRAYMAWGGLPMCLLAAAIFFPVRGAGAFGAGLYLAVTLSVFWVFFTVYTVPYLALLSELATTHQTRVNLATFKATASLLGAALVFVLSPQLIAPLGFQGMVVVLSAFAVVTAYVTVVGVNERRYAVSEPSAVRLLASIRQTFADRAFVRYLLAFLLFWLGFNVVTTGIPFYVKNLLGLPEAAAGGLMGVAFGGAFLAFPLVNRVALHLGLKRAFWACMILFAAVLPLIYFWESAPLGLSPKTVAYAVMALAGLPLAGLFVLPDAIVARLAHRTTCAEGSGREGMYFGVQGFCLKLTFGLSGSLMGLLFDLFGKGGSAGNLGLKLTAPAGGLLVALGAVVFARFPSDALKDNAR